MGIEHRRSQRIFFKKPILINNSVKAQGLDISESGMYVSTGRHFPPGTIVVLSVPLEEETLSVRAKVQHSQSGVGMGLMFVELSNEQRISIRSFVADVSEEVAAPPQKKKILIVDDNVTHRVMNKSRLVAEGYAVSEAGDGAVAIGMIEQEKFDLIVLDLYLERLDGYKVLASIRQKPELKDMPVLVLTARATPEEKQRAMGAGATEFHIKMTTSPIKLSEHVAKYLKR